MTESDTRRQAATEFTRALMEHFERDVTEIIKGYISTFLQVGDGRTLSAWLTSRNISPTPVESGRAKTLPFTYSPPSPPGGPLSR